MGVVKLNNRSGKWPGLGFENSDNLCRGYNPSWFPERKLDNAWMIAGGKRWRR